MKLLLLGATGLVGRNVLELALTDARVGSVIAPVRRPLSAHPKLIAPIVDFENLPEEATWWQADAVVCALGTTMHKAGSPAAFRRVDFDFPLMAASHARRHGVPTFVVISAIGADPSSRVFYNRVKGELERELGQIGFRSLTIVRPGLIGGKREEVRAGEHIAMIILRLLHPLLPLRWRINPAERIASALLEAAVKAEPGRHYIPSHQLV